jgi:hypothetical protein
MASLMGTAAAPQPVIEWGWAGRAFGAGDESGDVHVVMLLPNGALLAVIDGLGHGTEARAAACEAAAVLTKDPARPPLELIQRCHEALRRTRGAVMSVVRIHAADSALEWCGVGNVEAILLRADRAQRGTESVVARGGVVGYRLPALKAARVGLCPRDVLFMATDGIDSEFSADLSLDESPQWLADQILAHHAKVSDDALVLVARYLGANS